METSLLVRAIWEESREPAAGLGCVVSFNQQDDKTRQKLRGSLDEAGVWKIPAAPAGSVFVRLDRGTALNGTVEPDRANELMLVVPAGVRVRGRVLDEAFHPVTDAEVLLVSRRDAAPWPVARSGADGVFEVRGLSPGAQLFAQAAGHTASGVASLSREATLVSDLVLRLGPRGGTLDIHVTDSRGEAVAGAAVQLGNNYGLGPPYPGEPAQSGEAPFRTMVTDAEGRALVEDVPIQIVPILVRATGFSPWNTALKPKSGETLRLDVVLEPGASVEGIVTNTKSEPAGNVVVTLGMDFGFGSATATSGPDGRYTIPDAPLGEQRIVAGAEQDRADLDIAAGAHLVWNATLADEPLAKAIFSSAGQLMVKVIVPVQLTCHRQVPPAGRLVVTGVDGKPIESRSLYWLPASAGADSHVMRANLDLAAGTFNLRIEAEGVLVLAQPVVVSVGPSTAPLVELTFD